MADTGLQFKVDIGSAQNVNCTKSLLLAHQLLAGLKISNEKTISAFFEKVFVRENFVEVNGQKNPKDSLNIKFAGKSYLNQNRDHDFLLKRIRWWLVNQY